MSAHRAWPLYVMAVLWLRYLTEINKSTEEVPAELLENEQTRKAISLVEKSTMSEGQLYAYELLDVYPRRGGPHRDKIFMTLQSMPTPGECFHTAWGLHRLSFIFH